MMDKEELTEEIVENIIGIIEEFSTIDDYLDCLVDADVVIDKIREEYDL